MSVFGDPEADKKERSPWDDAITVDMLRDAVATAVRVLGGDGDPGDTVGSVRANSYSKNPEAVGLIANVLIEFGGHVLDLAAGKAK